MGAELIVNQAQTSTCDRAQEQVLVRAHVIFNQVFVVSANAAAPTGTGQSLVVDPEGRVRTDIPSQGAGVLTDVLNLDEVERVRRFGTAGLNRVWGQFRPDDPTLELPADNGYLDPASGLSTNLTATGARRNVTRRLIGVLVRGKGCAHAPQFALPHTNPGLPGGHRPTRGSRMSSTNVPRRRSATFDGRLNLAQQRKRAKELLKAVRAGDEAASRRIAEHRPRQRDAFRLADAQFVIARECGFASWPKLKAHVDALDFARRHIANEGDRDLRTLHIRCGSDIEHTLRIAGFQGEFLEFSDPFCIGPVPALPRDDLIATRARFLAGAFDLYEADALARQRRQYDALADLFGYERIALWFEHDAYDQLILAYVLKCLGGQQPNARVELIAVDSVPGVERFIGIGQLAPDLLAWLWRQRKPVTEAQRALGETAWSAITAPTPEPLDALTRTGTPALPMMGRALRRHLQELPSRENGLGLTEQLTLEIVRDLGPITAGRAFRELMMAREPLPYLGDLMFWWIIQPLLRADSPALAINGGDDLEWPQRELAVTTTGAALLDGKRNWLDIAPATRWVGGVRIAGDTAGTWCLDRETERIFRL